MDFNQIYNNTETPVKLDFLHSLLIKNEGLKNQFLEYCKPAIHGVGTSENLKDAEKRIVESCGNFKTELEALDFEDFDWKDYTPRHSGYIEDYEAMEYYAEDQLNEIFAFWKDQIRSQISSGQLLYATYNILGTYDACLNAEIPGSDDIFNDLTETLLQDHEEILNDAITTISASVISSEGAVHSVETVLNHYFYSYPGIKNYLKYFEPFFMSLAETLEKASAILEILKRLNIDESRLPRLIVKLYSFQQDQTAWVKKAGQYFMDDLQVAKKLLDYNFEHDVVAFLRDAQILFARQPDEFAKFLHERIYPDLDPDFFKKVLWHRASRERNIGLYDALRPYLDEREKQLFIDGIEYDILFLVKVLELENRFSEILQLAQKEVEFTWNFPELITPVLNKFPHEAFELIKYKTTRTLENERGRHAYQRICTYLQLALQIPERETETSHLIHDLYNRKPALPALKDEMRKAALISKS